MDLDISQSICNAALKAQMVAALPIHEALEQLVNGAIRYYRMAESMSRIRFEYPVNPEYTRLSLKLLSMPPWRRWFSWRLRRRVEKLKVEHRRIVMDRVLEAVCWRLE
jgi:hypothetical protein